MSRVINPNQPGKLRKQLLRAVAAARAAYVGSRPEQRDPAAAVSLEARDQVAFVILSLRQIEATVLRTVEAWEKRDYWLKADRFRLEWAWAGQCAQQLELALAAGEPEEVDKAMEGLARHLAEVPPLQKYLRLEPWRGAWRLLSDQTDGRAARRGAQVG